MRDAEGAAFGIIRLWCLYKFNETEFIQYGIISAELGNGQVVRSRPSVIKVNCELYCVILSTFLVFYFYIIF